MQTMENGTLIYGPATQQKWRHWANGKSAYLVEITIQAGGPNQFQAKTEFRDRSYASIDELASRAATKVINDIFQHCLDVDLDVSNLAFVFLYPEQAQPQECVPKNYFCERT